VPVLSSHLTFSLLNFTSAVRVSLLNFSVCSFETHTGEANAAEQMTPVAINAHEIAIAEMTFRISFLPMGLEASGT
jgi:hypothetical protein